MATPVDKPTSHKPKEVSPKEKKLPDWLEDMLKKSGMKKVESPRAYVIIMVAYIEDVLTKVLKSNLVLPIDNKGEDLFSQYAPLFHLGAKIRLAYRMGLISPEMRWMLDMLRELRDDCAHSHTELDLKQSPYRDKIDEMQRRLTDDLANGEDKYNDITIAVLISLHTQFEKSKPSIQGKQKESIFR